MQGGIIQSIKTNNKNIDLKVFDYDDILGNTIEEVEKQEIIFNKDLKDPKQIQDTINHENVHIEQMASGELDYDEQAVYFKGKKYLRKEFDESNKKLPWEIDAYKAG